MGSYRIGKERAYLGAARALGCLMLCQRLTSCGWAPQHWSPASIFTIDVVSLSFDKLRVSWIPYTRQASVEVLPLLCYRSRLMLSNSMAGDCGHRCCSITACINGRVAAALHLCEQSASGTHKHALICLVIWRTALTPWSHLELMDWLEKRKWVQVLKLLGLPAAGHGAGHKAHRGGRAHPCLLHGQGPAAGGAAGQAASTRIAPPTPTSSPSGPLVRCPGDLPDQLLCTVDCSSSSKTFSVPWAPTPLPVTSLIVRIRGWQGACMHPQPVLMLGLSVSF